jgi:hypothetical protein
MKPLIVLIAICTLGYTVDHWQELTHRFNNGTEATGNAHELIIYENNSSSACVQLMGQLKKSGIAFEKRDLSKQANSNELTDKLARVGKMKGSIAIPVAELDGVLIEGATIYDITPRMK